MIEAPDIQHAVPASTSTLDVEQQRFPFWRYKIIAISGTVLIFYFGMRLWVFVRNPQVCIALQNEEGADYNVRTNV